MKLSAAVVVNNDMSTIEETLLSIAPHVDEIVVVDQDSRDLTKTVVKKASHKIMRDFGIKTSYLIDRRRTLRQDSRGLAQTACEGGWVLHLEPGEELSQRLLGDLPGWLQNPRVRGALLKLGNGEHEYRLFEKDSLREGLEPICRQSEIVVPEYVAITNIREEESALNT